MVFVCFLIPDSQCLKITVLVMELKHLFFSIEEIPVIHKVTKFRLETEEKVCTVLHTTNSINSGAGVQKNPKWLL